MKIAGRYWRVRPPFICLWKVSSLWTMLALLIGIAGWYYLFYSRAAHRLGAVEAAPANVRRIRLRRLNGLSMLMLAALLYIGTRAIDWQREPLVFLAIWISNLLLLLIVVILGLIDVRMTMNLRKRGAGR